MTAGTIIPRTPRNSVNRGIGIPANDRPKPIGRDADATSPTVTAQEQGSIVQDSRTRLLDERRDLQVRGAGFFVTEHFE
jgi:hypothetical protein